MCLKFLIGRYIYGIYCQEENLSYRITCRTNVFRRGNTAYGIVCFLDVRKGFLKNSEDLLVSIYV